MRRSCRYPYAGDGCPLRSAAPYGLLPLWVAAPYRGPGRSRPPLAGRSYILVFHIRMKKMKEVKRPPL
ncbi:hypothetical protein GW17_00058664 [Ensete ventricosum]|uniref:Uncharacterized protein n=1 Tax=Ensete ventricosum TaxID=4639 RepID=A0A444C2M5_ENSVE|nr:hypothetical protein B296_00005307 [Ensete ventricosum]RWV80106.1 hypothetical protein GW17_00058664 [Ensete ventricosum]